MTAVKTIDGAPLDNNAPTAVQLEPSGLVFNEFVTLTEWGKQAKSIMEHYDDQVIRKSIASAELDCRFARRAIQDLGTKL